MREPLNDYVELWVIYERPVDWPDSFVVRRQKVMLADRIERLWIDPIGLAYDTLAAARAALPYGLVNIGRSDDDAPSIKEVWV